MIFVPQAGKMVNLLQLLTIVVLVNLASGCAYNVEEELYPSDECKTVNVAYRADVLPILENNCYRCHDAANNQGGITIEGYDNLKAFVDSGALLGAIRRDPGFSPMPQDGPKLPDCEIGKIVAWVNDGAPNN